MPAPMTGTYVVGTGIAVIAAIAVHVSVNCMRRLDHSGRTYLPILAMDGTIPL